MWPTCPSGQPIHVPQISAWNYGGISGDHPRGNFLIISLQKFRRNKGEFSMWIFPPIFPRESPGIFPYGSFPHISLKISKCHKRSLQRVPVVKKHPSDVLMSILWWIERFNGSGKFLSHFNPEFWGKLRGCFCGEISKRFSTAYNKWSMLIKPPVCHPANFIGDNMKVWGIWYIFS